MLCGDITGKMLVPIVKWPDGTHTGRVLGLEERVTTEEELKKLEEKLCNMGFYPYHTDPDGMKEMQGEPAKVNEVFRRLMLERLAR